MSGPRVGIIQSNYIPWKGYFDFIDSVDEFVLFDEVQYTRRDWRNRNRIKTKDGLKWLTIPVEVKGKYDQRVSETRISDKRWAHEHASSLRHAYGKSPHFREEWTWIEPLYEESASVDFLSSVNELFIRAIRDRLSIQTPIRLSSEFDLPDGKNERLISICKQLGAAEYLSGPAARGYIDESLWTAAGIRVTYKSYDDYPEYAQPYPPFEHAVSIVDLLFNTGPQAPSYIKGTADVRS